MRILYLGAFHDPFCTEGYVASAFEKLGHELVRLDESNTDAAQILDMAATNTFDLFLFAKGRFKEAQGDWPDAAYPIVKLVSQLKAHIPIIVCWHWDLVAREYSAARWQWQSLVSQAVDLTVLTDGYSAAQLPKTIVIRDGSPPLPPEKGWGAGDDILPLPPGEGWGGGGGITHGSPSISTQPAPAPPSRVLFIGSAYRDRSQWLAVLHRRLGSRFLHIGPGGDGFAELKIPLGREVRGQLLTRLVRRFCLCLQPPWPYFPRYWSDRITVLGAHGALIVAPTIEGMDADGWLSGINYLSAPLDFDRYADKVVEYLDRYDPERLETVRRACTAHARWLTWEKRVGEFLSKLKPPQ